MIAADTPSQGDGWLDPHGNYYACGFYKHDAFARMFLKDSSAKACDLEERGWMRLSCGMVVNKKRDGVLFRPTQPQIDTSFDIIRMDPGTTLSSDLHYIIKHADSC